MSLPIQIGVVDRLRERVAEHPERAALTYPVGRTKAGRVPEYDQLSYRDVDEWSEALAQGFDEAGIARGTRTIVLVTPGPELYVSLFALLKIGAVPVVIDPGMGLRRMLSCLRAVDAEAFIGVPPAHAVRTVFRRYFRDVRTKITVGRRWFWGGHALRTWGRAPAVAKPSRPQIPAGELAMIVFTTGSTGPAKAVEMTHGMLAAMIDQVDVARERTAPGTSLITLPLFGVIDILLGSRCVLPPLVPGKVGSTDPAQVVDAIQRFEVRTLFGSPALLVPLLAHLEDTRAQLPTLRSIYSGGAPVPHTCIAGLRGVLDRDVEVHAGYGATEAIPMASIESRELLGGLIERAQLGEGTCLGRPSFGLEARVVAISDEPIARWADAEELQGQVGEVGEVVVSGPNVSTRYYWPEKANALGKIVDGDRIWHRTGDLGWIDDDGRIWFCGRKSQRVRTAERTMFTVQCEQVFAGVDGVARTALVGVGSPGSQRPVLCVEVAPGLADERRGRLLDDLRATAQGHDCTAPIDDFLVHPGFPVDIRHNAKIGREELAVWAQKKLSDRKRWRR